MSLLDERDAAVRDALDSGFAIDAVAAALSVRDDDIRRMADRAVEHPVPRHNP